MKVSCLCATHGRYTVLREAISCFLLQNYENKELLILNNHPVPLVYNLPQVKIYNEPKYATLGDCRNRLLELADGELLRTWDDDDFYLPWAIKQGVEMIEDYVAFKPKRSWFCLQRKKYTLTENVFEASITFRTDFVRKYGYQSSGGDEHNPLMFALQKGGCRIEEMGIWASYVYRWGDGLHKISGTLGSDTVENRTERWKKANDDHGNEVPIEPVSLSKYFYDINITTETEFHEKNPLLSRFYENNRLSF